ncbi:MAG TPA: hypothetical protein VNU46_02380 [Gemmatimonadaceae bacterium]|jgi:hypothetical protein|nr:hypothetical protein [Gemmatimonadaceae bacterium]
MTVHLMMAKTPRRNRRLRTAGQRCAATAALTILAGTSAANAQGRGILRDGFFWPDNLVVSRSVYDNNAKNITVGQVLPPNCVTGCSAATNDGSYPFVWNNDIADANFGITSKIFLDQMTPFGLPINSIEVPNSSQHGVTDKRNQLVTSFSSKSEMALNLSTDGQYLTFMGYVAPVNAVDVSNSNTPGAIDSTNPVPDAYFRAAAQVDRFGRFQFTMTNAYSGNNGRAAILYDTRDGGYLYTAGNAGNGANPQPDGILLGGGAQTLLPDDRPEIRQDPDAPTPVGSFNITELGAAHDKLGKDNNFRGLTIFNNVLFYTKGSGGNGVNTVYFIDVTGHACPNGVGLPQSGVKLPDAPLPYDSALLQTKGLQPNNMCILKGFPSALNSALKAKTTAYPFGIWFANATTLYLADEGDGNYADAGLTNAGLQKWVFNASTSQWELAYTLQAGLGLGVTYSFPGDRLYPTGNNAATGLPWAPVTDGLRNITGRVNRDGTVTIWGITSTVSGNGDQGADPNKLVAITDLLNNTSATAAQKESFRTIRTAAYGEVLRGVSFTPGSDLDQR